MELEHISIPHIRHSCMCPPPPLFSLSRFTTLAVLIVCLISVANDPTKLPPNLLPHTGNAIWNYVSVGFSCCFFHLAWTCNPSDVWAWQALAKKLWNCANSSGFFHWQSGWVKLKIVNYGFQNERKYLLVTNANSARFKCGKHNWKLL